MATVLNKLVIDLKLKPIYTNDLSPEDVVDSRVFQVFDSLTDGNAVDQAQAWHFSRQTVSASGTNDHDLAGGLTDSFGNTLTLVKVKLILIHNRSTTAGDILHIGGDTNSVPIFGAAADFIKLGPGGLFLWYDPSAAAISVTASTGDILQVAEQGGANTVTYDLLFAGTDA